MENSIYKTIFNKDMFSDKIAITNQNQRYKKMRLKKLMLATLVASSLVAHAHAELSTSFLKGSVYETVGLTENVDPLLLYSISLVESAKASKQKNISLVTPHKFVIRTPDGPVYPTTFRNAKKWLSYCIRKYDKKQLDVGLMQINGIHFSKIKDPSELLNPEINVKVASRILKNAMDSAPYNKSVGIGRYHSYTAWRAKAYGERVIAVYRNLKKGNL